MKINSIISTFIHFWYGFVNFVHTISGVDRSSSEGLCGVSLECFGFFLAILNSDFDSVSLHCSISTFISRSEGQSNDSGPRKVPYYNSQTF